MRESNDLADCPLLVLVASGADAPVAQASGYPAMGMVKLHWKVLGPKGRRVLQSLFARPLIRRHFVLCGGTALALREGHRRSFDLDLFSIGRHPTVDSPAALTAALRTAGVVRDLRIEHGSLEAQVDGVRVSMLPYVYGLARRPLRQESIRIADPFDLGMMKISAIMSRGKRRDFIDLACILDRHADLTRLLRALRRSVPASADPTLGAARSLLDVRAAELEHDPPGLIAQYRWPVVRFKLEAAAREVVRRLTR